MSTAVTAPALGYIARFAGNGIGPGDTGDGGPATLAALYAQVRRPAAAYAIAVSLHHVLILRHNSDVFSCIPRNAPYA